MNHEPPAADARLPGPALLARLHELLEAGRYLSAWKLVQGGAPLAAWPGPRGRALAGRLAGWLGDERLQRGLWRLNLRRHPEDDEAFLHACFVGPVRGGWLDAIERIGARLAERPEMAPGIRADLLAMRAVLLGQLHDFSPAWRDLRAALDLVPDSAWLLTQRSILFDLEDRYDAAVAAAREAVAAGGAQAPPRLQLSEALVHAQRDDEAIAALEAGHELGECGRFALRLVRLFSEREETDRALYYLDAFLERSPLRNQALKEWAVQRRADLLYRRGDWDGALAQCAQAPPDSFHARQARRMREPGARSRSRVRLEVPFIRQHDMTCGPATLASLAAYWQRDADHREIAAAICYHGTSWHKERAWTEEHGFLTREFRLTREILRGLIDRGVPFTLVTEGVGWAHLQACVGYDDRLGTVILRDPTERHFGEMFLDRLIESHPVQGPRCLALLPPEERGRLAGLEFPDAEVYDRYHQFGLALDAHDRQAALAALDAMPAEHPLAVYGQFRLASYDENPLAERHALETLLERFPENGPLRLAWIQALWRGLDFRRLKPALEEATRPADADPLFHAERGHFLLRDARHLAAAEFYLRRAVRRNPRAARGYAALAECREKQRRFDEAAALRRAAACLEPGWEPYAAGYAASCRAIGQPEAGVAFLRERAEKWGRGGGAPWQTLAEELHTQRRFDEAIAALEEGIAARPDDGALLLASSRLFLFWGETARAETLRDAARGKVREAEWLKSAARFAEFSGDRETAIRHWRDLLALEPDSEEGHRALAGLIAEAEGNAAAARLLETATEVRPDLPSFWILRAEREALDSPARAAASLERALALDPDHAGGWRELAICRLQAGDPEGALRAAREAVARDPSAASFGTLGTVHEQSGRAGAAREAFREALRRSVDHTGALEGLMRLASGHAEALETLAFVEAELRRQVSDGGVVPVYRQLAYPRLAPEALLDRLREFCAERPDLWQTWSARIAQALDMGWRDEAEECARTMTERFPLLPPAWSDLAAARRAAGDYEGEVEALSRVLALAPTWSEMACRLAAALERLERYDEAIATLERARHQSPLAGETHGCLANLLRKLGRPEEAFGVLWDGLRRCPEYAWGWRTIASWAATPEERERVAALISEQRESRARSVEWFEVGAQVLRQFGRNEQALELIETGAERFPEAAEPRALKAMLLADAGRFDEALATCDAALRQFPGHRVLAGRRAEVLMRAGHPRQAVREMRALLEREPDYVGGLQRLIEWLGTRQEQREVRRLAQRWVRLEPQNPRAWGALAEAEEGLNRGADAERAYARAFALDPEYAFAGHGLLRCQLGNDRFDAAEETLNTLRHYLPPPQSALLAFELIVARGDQPGALRQAEQLFDAETADAEVFAWMGRLFAQAGWQSAWREALSARVNGEPPPSPGVLAAWIASLEGGRGLEAGIPTLDRLRRHDETLAATGWAALLERAGSSARPRRIRAWIRRRKRWLHARPETWAAVGEALLQLRDYRATRKWLADWWRRGEAVPQSALFCYGAAVASLEGWPAAVEAREMALRLDPASPIAPPLRAVVALQTALRGNFAAAERLGAEVAPDQLEPYYAGLFQLHQSLMAAHAGRFPEARSHYRKACQTFGQWARDREIASFFASVQETLARLVPAANGKARELRSKWGDYQPPSRGSLDGESWKIALWLLLLLALPLMATVGGERFMWLPFSVLLIRTGLAWFGR